jgi:hypothetical protein
MRRAEYQRENKIRDRPTDRSDADAQQDKLNLQALEAGQERQLATKEHNTSC